MADTKLPPLPEPAIYSSEHIGYEHVVRRPIGFAATQMLERDNAVLEAAAKALETEGDFYSYPSRQNYYRAASVVRSLKH